MYGTPLRAHVEAQCVDSAYEKMVYAHGWYMARPIDRVGYGSNQSASGGSRGAARALY